MDNLDVTIFGTRNTLAVDTEMSDLTSAGPGNRSSSRVRFSDAVSEEEEAAAALPNKKKTRYWSKGDRRYSEAEKAFLSRARIRSVVRREGKQEKFGWLKYFDPGGDRLYFWLLVVSLAVLYNCWAIILRTAFPQINDKITYIWLILDYSCDLIYIADILVSMRTGFLEEGILQTCSTKMRRHYLHTYEFYLDAGALIPLDIAYIFIEHEPAFRINRILKFHRFWHFLDRTESRTTFPNVVRLASLVQFILLIIHWNACIYFIVSREIGFGSDVWVYPGVRQEILNSSENTISRMYIYSFYWSTLTLTTIGEVPPPYSEVEYIIVTLDYLIGVLLFATIVGNVGNIITNLNATRLDFQNKMDGIKAYMRFHKIPQHLQRRVIKWFDYLWTYKKHPDEEEILLSLPDKLRAEIAINVHLDSLRKVAIFQDCEAGFLCELVLRLRSQLFSPGDYVCRKGEVGREMYIVNRGKLEVVSEHGTKIYAVLEAGSYFGEISVLSMSSAGNRRTASVRSVGYTELFCLAKNDLMEVLDEYPNIKEKIEKIAKEKLENDKRRTSMSLNRAASFRNNSGPRKPNGGGDGTTNENVTLKLETKIETLERKKDELGKELQRQKVEYDERLNTLETALSELLKAKGIDLKGLGLKDDSGSAASLKTSQESVWKKR
ncbi:cyclic nucleotide-gated cation channel alpha-3 isoform X3 [Nematostella vectensis]|uniref:cyclic nucleotide-gated cation channel alpha-3 isoform X3 n=1 Tax=Nematostella vectensis TaxID=45351 RepID=UPI00207751D5|nr:cyclic nucleotide-gated cation channel alpha-3 isoform X3 [Nematostella vectensis]